MSTAPTLDAHDIKHRETRLFLDREFVFTVIGSSHYVCCEAANYHELLTCKQLDTAPPTPRDGRRLTETVPLTVGHTETVRHTLDGTGITVEIRGEPLSAFDSSETFDIAYRFDTDAYTTIDILADGTYQTYHTYPEHDLALRTETSLVGLDSAGRG